MNAPRRKGDRTGGQNTTQASVRLLAPAYELLSAAETEALLGALARALAPYLDGDRTSPGSLAPAELDV